ncbi:Thiamine-phosphate synthase [Pirellulimonas nuda]|uniref:Thiamine-phosphate synthase n=1 Tax=Pirellulimonas nuda TaxID=2528009 RepID=A0A518D8S3_9BACT|nr:thiamine phosphate synthase [Pirellulimonas nuda]QDU87875.1 Thiamine-phosphate synthase [Pirellulimonas nuda]
MSQNPAKQAPAEQTPGKPFRGHDAWRIVDSSRNRANEGLRVVEDFLRFVLDDPHLTSLAKQLRHDLQSACQELPSQSLVAMRDTQGDVGVSIATDSEQRRDDPLHVCQASLKRVEQSLRSLEEYGKLLSPLFASRVEALRYRCYTLEKAIGHTRGALQRLGRVRLCVLVDGGPTPQGFADLVDALARAGVDALQLRDKRLSGHALVERARTLVRIAKPLGVLAIVNDRPDVAAVAGADGVHVGQDDLAVSDARRIVGPDALIGVSTHSLAQAGQAVRDGADYLGAGPTFASRTKAFDGLAGLGYLREVSQQVRLPTFAIGGIDADNLPEVLAAGATRIAVGAAVTAAPDPAGSVLALKRLLSPPSVPASSSPTP